MFLESYSFNYIQSRRANKTESFQLEHKYSFTCRFKQRYIVNVEEYDYKIFVIKFHLKNHTDSKDKYSIKTNFNDAPRVIRTCINIMLSIADDFNLASFGFVGANSLDEPSKELTKRFRIYRVLMYSFFSTVNYLHFEYPKESAYLLLNRANEEENLLEKVEGMFREIYLFNQSDQDS